MNTEKIIFLICAIFTTIAFIGVGISIAEGNIIVFGLSIVIAAICVVIGFSVRKKLAS